MIYQKYLLIYQKCTSNFSMVLSIRYSQIINSEALYESNLKGFAFSAVYLTIYYYLCTPQKKKENMIYMSSGAGLCTFIYYYSANADPSTIAVKYESILTSVLWSFHFIALLGVYGGFKGKTSAHFGLEMVSASALMGMNRICYGILKNRQFYVVSFDKFDTKYKLNYEFYIFSSNTSSSWV